MKSASEATCFVRENCNCHSKKNGSRSSSSSSHTLPLSVTV